MTKISANRIINDDLTLAEQQRISNTIERLGRAMMTESAHGYLAGENKTIMLAATQSVRNYEDKSKLSSAITIMDVILAANRNYNKQVKPHIDCLLKSHPSLTIRQLDRMTKEMDTAENFKKIWGHNDEQKFQTLKSLLTVIVPKLKNVDDSYNDRQVMLEWAANTQLSSISQDSIGKIKYIGIATFQHLRMNFGVNTVKPDRQVKEVLNREFNLRLSDTKSILVVERMAKIEQTSPLLIDQIFVKYGSGYYAKRAPMQRCSLSQ